MKAGYVIREQDKAHFITCTIVDWIDIFTRQVYRVFKNGSTKSGDFVQRGFYVKKMKMTLILKRIINLLSVIITSVFLYSCAANNAATSGYKSTTVSYYANKFEGKKTASGEVYRHSKMTAANKTLPFGTKVEIINPENSKKVIVTVNDRGPLKSSREFDLSQGAFKRIGNLNSGVLKVKYKIIR